MASLSFNPLTPDPLDIIKRPITRGNSNEDGSVSAHCLIRERLAWPRHVITLPLSWREPFARLSKAGRSRHILKNMEESALDRYLRKNANITSVFNRIEPSSNTMRLKILPFSMFQGFKMALLC